VAVGLVVAVGVVSVGVERGQTPQRARSERERERERERETERQTERQRESDGETCVSRVRVLCS